MSADNFAYVFPEEEQDMLHRQGNPFCPIDPGCPCHEDQTLIAEVAEYVANGEMTPARSNRLCEWENAMREQVANPIPRRATATQSYVPANPHKAGHYSGFHPEDAPYQSTDIAGG